MAARAPKKVLESIENNDDDNKKKSVRGTGRTGAPAANDAAKYRLYPTDEQYVQISRGIGNARYYWNMILDVACITSELHKDGDPNVPCPITITPAEAKKWDDCTFLADTDSLILANVQKNYQQAWKNYRENPKHYRRPTWKKRQGRTGSYTTNNQPKWDKEKNCYITPGNIRIEDSKIYLPKVGWVKLKQHYPLPEDAIIKNVTVSRDAAGKCYVSIGYYNPELAEVLEKAGVDPDQESFVITGLDYSNPLMFVTPEGLHPKDLHYYRANEKKLAKLQRRLAKRTPGSANYKKLSERIGRLQRRIANQRNDLLHKLSCMLAKSCDIVCVEDLDLRALGRRRKGFRLSKNLYDNGWGKFLTYLEYKLARRGGVLVRVGRFFPSSKRCHHCGTLYEDLVLSDREWDCPECGAHHDRDVNAAWNIMFEGIRMLRAGEVAGVGVPDAVVFSCAGGMPVAAESTAPSGAVLPGDAQDFGVVPVEGGKTWSDYPSCWSDLLVSDKCISKGSPDQSEAGIKEVPACGRVTGHTEAATDKAPLAAPFSGR